MRFFKADAEKTIMAIIYSITVPLNSLVTPKKLKILILAMMSFAAMC